MPVRTDLPSERSDLEFCCPCVFGCERQQPGQREQQPEQRASDSSMSSTLGPDKAWRSCRSSSPLPHGNALVAWFECEECTDNELERVVDYGEVVVPNLAATLQGGVITVQARGGPATPPGNLPRTGRIRQGAQGLIAANVRAGVSGYVSENAEALYRLRAATALGRIGTPAARAALERGLTLKELRPEVRREVERALQGRDGPDPIDKQARGKTVSERRR